MRYTKARFVFCAVFVAMCGCIDTQHAMDPEQSIDANNTNALKATPGQVLLARYPAISPDGTQIAFSWRGDIWKVDAAGGHANRLTSHPSDDVRPAWCPDSKSLAFISNRTGSLNLFTMSNDGTKITPVTDIDRTCSLTAFGTDQAGKPVLTFSASLEMDVFRSSRPYMVSVEGGDIRRVHDAFGYHPVTSPNGRYVAFTRGTSSWHRRHYMGSDAREVWLYDRTNNSYRQITHWTGNDGKAKWMNDNTLLFLSDRINNTVNLYQINPTSTNPGTPIAITHFSDFDIWDYDVSRNGATAVIGKRGHLYTLDLTDPNATPVKLHITASEDLRDQIELKIINREVSEAALSPDGQTMAYVAYGEIYIRNMDELSETRRVTHSHARDQGIAWAPDGVSLYFTSDRDGSESIYIAKVKRTRTEIKEAYELSIAPPAPPNPPDDLDNNEDDTSDTDNANNTDSVTDDNTTIASEITEADNSNAAHGNEDADNSDEDTTEDKEDEAEEVEKDLLPEFDPTRWHDVVEFVITPIIADVSENDREANPSPDGHYVLSRRGRGDLRLLDLETNESRTIVTGWDGSIEGRWSPDSKHIAYHQNDMDFNSDIWIIAVDDDAEPVNISRHPDEEYSPRWSADGKVLSFISERINDEFDVWMVYLDASLETLSEKELTDYYDSAAETAKNREPIEPIQPDDEAEDSETEIDDSNDDANVDEDNKTNEDNADNVDKEIESKPLDLKDAYLRLRRITRIPGNENNNELTPGGDYYIYTGNPGESGLYSRKWDGSDEAKLTGSANVQHVTMTGDTIVFVSGGRAGVVSPSGGKVTYVDVSDQIEIDLKKQSSQKFLEAARTLGEQFYHPTMKDLDWDQISDSYHRLALATRTAGEFNYVAAKLIGELNGSHLGIWAPDDFESDISMSIGRLGTTHHRVTIERPQSADSDENTTKPVNAKPVSGFYVDSILPESPAQTGLMKLETDDIIIAIDGKQFSASDTLESRLRGKNNKETLVTIIRTLEDGRRIETELYLTPISFGTTRNLVYDAWRNDNADKVHQWSNGRLGYIHIQSMNQSSLEVFERDLYAAAHQRDGLIVDVRNNGGGWTADRVLASLTVQPHAYTIPRGANPNDIGHYPQGRLYIQRYTLPTNMLCNERSFSNAEIVAHAFKTLNRGTLVGQTTYGGVISTGATTLIDGTYVRLPFRGWFLLDGSDMENNGAEPDILVPQTPEDESDNFDAQLKVAVDDLLDRIENE